MNLTYVTGRNILWVIGGVRQEISSEYYVYNCYCPLRGELLKKKYARSGYCIEAPWISKLRGRNKKRHYSPPKGNGIL
jgi:hypothetical protein